MNTIFTNNIEETRLFLDKIDFGNPIASVSGYKDSVPDAVKGGNDYQLKNLVEGDKTSQVLVIKGLLGINRFFDLLVEELKLTYINTVVENPITQTVNFNTPFGFTFHVRVVTA